MLYLHCESTGCIPIEVFVSTTVKEIKEMQTINKSMFVYISSTVCISSKLCSAERNSRESLFPNQQSGTKAKKQRECKTADEMLLHGETVKCNETILKFYRPAFKMHHNEELPWSHPFTHKAFLVHSTYYRWMLTRLAARNEKRMKSGTKWSRPAPHGEGWNVTGQITTQGNER